MTEPNADVELLPVENNPNDAELTLRALNEPPKQEKRGGVIEREIRILILEDKDEEAALMERELRSGGLRFASRLVGSEADFLMELQAFKPDLIISDFTLPGFGGGEALKIARERLPDTPFIYVSGSIGEEKAIEALKSGATDYVLKDRMARLLPCIQRALREARERAESRRMQEELLQSAKMASVGLLIGGVAHELNNPLTSILGSAQLLLLENPRGTQLHQDLVVIEQETNRCIRLIKSLLAFARKHEHKFIRADINALALEMLALKTFDLRRSGTKLVQDLAEALPPVLADPHQIQQVLLNLLNNAEQAMEKAKGSVRVETRLEGGRVLLCVADTGPGIAPEHLDRVFEPFFTTKEPGKGTGLGLSICATIVKEHGGSLAVESRPGKGARFTMALPAAPAAPPEPTPPLRKRPWRVLVVDDQEEVLRLMARALKQSGREVEACAKPLEALVALRRGPFDLVISDFQMPDMNGERFYREATHIRPELAKRFLLLTGQTHLDEARPFSEAAKVPILVKPFELREFERTVTEVLSLGGAKHRKNSPADNR